MSVTIYDIAERADVSIATVSRVFNEHPRVSTATRERVFEVARDLGYRPHVSAQNLARRRTQLISAVVPVMTNYFYMEVIRGMQDALKDTDYELLLYTSPAPEEVGSQLRRAAQRGRADGLLLLSTPLTEERRKMLLQSRQPVVLVDMMDADFDSVTVDNEKGGYMATRHLIAGGYRRIAHLTIDPEPDPARARRIGYEQALAEAEMPVDPALIAASSHRPYGFVEEAGYEGMQQLLALDELPDAVFAASDMQALGAIRAIEEVGLSVPDDIAVVGFDGLAIGQYAGLTTLEQPMYELGRQGVDRLLERIEHPDRATSQTVYAPHLVQRKTCGCAPDLHQNESPS